MPGICFCRRCELFRANMPESRLTVAAAQALEKANLPSENSRRARIAKGEGKRGGKKSE